MKYIPLAILLLFGLILRAQTTQPSSQTAPSAASRPSAEMMDQLQNDLHSVNTVEADFVEEKRLALLDHTITIRGHFAVQKPDRLVWIVHEPVKYAVSIQGETVRQWDEDTNRVQVIHLGSDPTFKAVSEQLSAWFMGNYKILTDTYDVSVAREKPLSLVFTPKPDSMGAKFLQRVTVSFADDDRYINDMVIVESGGSVTTLKYLNTQINKPIADDTWEIPPHDR
jgi:outer membrane lipoprotein-sorting protein